MKKLSIIIPAIFLIVFSIKAEQLVTEEVKILKIKIFDENHVDLIIDRKGPTCWFEDDHEKIKVYGDEKTINRWLAAFINAKNMNDGVITIQYDAAVSSGQNRSSCKCKKVILK